MGVIVGRRFFGSYVFRFVSLIMSNNETTIKSRKPSNL